MLYKLFSRDFLSSSYFNLRIILILVQDFSLRCLCQEPSLEKYIPKCLWNSISLICCPNTVEEGYTGVLVFQDIRSVSVFNGLNFTHQASAHLAIFSRSALRISAATSEISTVMKILVSSAQRRMLDPISIIISFIKTYKSSAPTIDPWGTPVLI